MCVVVSLHFSEGMKPSQRAKGMGVDHIETVGGRHRYVRHMMTHADRMAKGKPVIDISEPTAAFGGGRFRTPSAAGQTGKAAAHHCAVSKLARSRSEPAARCSAPRCARSCT